ncbi:uncharacterized protein [Antedon mediterranea]|uniref:uncharacterized protein isoform X2 n=1 Tax=Antedon mediterranea TaxID=105859 RepID=UPI003AF5DF51
MMFMGRLFKGGVYSNKYDIPVNPTIPYYNEEKIEKYLLKNQKDLCSNDSTFTPATMRARYKVDISKMFTDMELLKEAENNKESSEPTNLEKMVEVIKFTPGCRALIDGEGGIGKTTILRYLSYNWATGQSMKVFDNKIVFFLSLRDLNENDDILDLIVKQFDMKYFGLCTDLPEDPRLIEQFIITHDDKIVMLLDGLDEVRFNNQSLLSLFRKNKLKKGTVILTSRLENIDEFIKACDVHVRVKGFNEKNIGKYIEKHFVYFGKPQLGRSLRNKLNIGRWWVRRQKHPEMFSMCKNPMLLLSICILWEENQCFPENKADLFKEIFRSILNQYNKQEKFNKISNLEDTPVKLVNAMILLGKCMYYRLKENQLSINKTNLTEHSNKEIADMALNIGFVYEETPISKSNFEIILMPPHKLIVESLVGFYLCKLCESEGMVNKHTEDVRRLLTPLDENEWKSIRKNEYLMVAREFAIGFLGANASEFLKHYITNDLSSYRQLPSELNYAKKQHETVNALIDYMNTTDLEIKKHIGDISTSIRLFILHNSPEADCDENFIPLVLQLNCMKYVNKSSICSEMAWNGNGRGIAHILGIDAKCTNVHVKHLSGDLMNEMITECSNIGAELMLNELQICNNNLGNIDGTLLSSLLNLSPKLTVISMKNCNISGDVINNMIGGCLNTGVRLALISFNVNDNNFSNIDGGLLCSFLMLSPELRELDMGNCKLSGSVINHMIRECSNRSVLLGLECLNIHDNNLSNIDGTLLCSLLIMSPCLRRFDMSNCNLSGEIVNQMLMECLHRRVKLKTLQDLCLNKNDLSNVNGILLGLFIEMCIKTSYFPRIHNCNIPCNVIDNIVGCLHREKRDNFIMEYFYDNHDIRVILLRNAWAALILRGCWISAGWPSVVSYFIIDDQFFLFKIIRYISKHLKYKLREK